MKSIIEITEHYEKYKSLTFEAKTTKHEVVVFTKDKPSRPDFVYHLSSLIHILWADRIDLIAEQRKINQCSYKFQIRCPDFCGTPLFRFDSDGSCHKNDAVPLKHQQIPTPHFNRFDNKGKSYAYNTGLENVTYNDLRDIDRFFKLFCSECKLENENGRQPSIQSGDVRILNLDLHSDDLLSDVNFEL